METVTLPHFASHPLHICLFTAVQNAAFLHEQLLKGNTDFEYAFLDTSALISRRHVLAACVRAVNDLQNGRLKSRNVHSEIVFAFSPNANIAESFRRFGISRDSRNVVAIKVGGSAPVVEAHLQQNIQGELESFSDDNLASVRDVARIRKIYRLDAPKKGEPADQLDPEAEVFALASMALKGS